MFSQELIKDYTNTYKIRQIFISYGYTNFNLKWLQVTIKL